MSQIEQLQFHGVESVSATGRDKVRLNFNHPCKELIWAVSKGSTDKDKFINYTNSAVHANGSNPVTSAILKLNGHDRFSEQEGKYFNYVQTLAHTRTPNAGINVYSFALNPEEHQPSGSCNFSRFDNATLIVNTGSAGTSLYVSGVKYNVLRIMSGMGSIAYSN